MPLLLLSHGSNFEQTQSRQQQLRDKQDATSTGSSRTAATAAIMSPSSPVASSCGNSTSGDWRPGAALLNFHRTPGTPTAPTEPDFQKRISTYHGALRLIPRIRQAEGPKGVLEPTFSERRPPACSVLLLLFLSVSRVSGGPFTTSRKSKKNVDVYKHLSILFEKHATPSKWSPPPKRLNPLGLYRQKLNLGPPGCRTAHFSHFRSAFTIKSALGNRLFPGFQLPWLLQLWHPRLRI